MLFEHKLLNSLKNTLQLQLIRIHFLTIFKNEMIWTITNGYSPSETQLSVLNWYFSTFLWLLWPPTAKKKSRKKFTNSVQNVTFIWSYSYTVMIKLTFSYIIKSANGINSDMTSFCIRIVETQVHKYLVHSSTATTLKIKIEWSSSFQWAAFDFRDLSPINVSTEHVKVTTVYDRAATLNFCLLSKNEIKISASIIDLSTWVSDDGYFITVPSIQNKDRNMPFRSSSASCRRCSSWQLSRDQRFAFKLIELFLTKIRFLF